MFRKASKPAAAVVALPTGHKRSESKMSGILNAHKPLPLSELFSPGSTTTTTTSTTTTSNNNNSVKQQRNKAMIQYSAAVLIVLLFLMYLILRQLYDPSIPNPDLWMKDPLTISLLNKTPKTKNNMYTVFITLYQTNLRQDENDANHETFQTQNDDVQVQYGQSEQSAEMALQLAYRKVRPYITTFHRNKRYMQNHPSSYYYWIKVDALQDLNHESEFHYDKDGIPMNSGFGIGGSNGDDKNNNNSKKNKDWNSMVFLPDEVIGSALVLHDASSLSNDNDNNNNNNNSNENDNNNNQNNNNNKSRMMLRWDHIGKQWAKKNQHYHAQLLLRSPTSTTMKTMKWPTEINVEDSTVSIDFFRTQAIFYDGSSTTSTALTSISHPSSADMAKSMGIVIPLVKGRRVLGIADLTPDYLRHHAAMAGEYLARQVQINNNHQSNASAIISSTSTTTTTTTTGKMVYRYRPRSDTEPNDEDYNLTRHAGTAYAMAVLYKVNKTPSLLKALQASLDYLIHPQIMVNCPLAYPSDVSGSDEIQARSSKTTTKCIVNEIYHGHAWTQLGVNALALLAMAEYIDATKDTERYWQPANDLATWIGATQHDDGSFVQDQDIETGLLDEESYVRYYPGEAAFAMARLYNVATALNLNTKDNWKDIAANAMDFIVDRESDVEDEDFVNDHWMMYALAEMSSWHWTKEMLDFALRTGRIAQERQVRHHDNVMDQDRNGIYIHKNGEDIQSLSSCATATKSEGLCAVYPVIQKHAPDRANMILDSVKWGIRYQLGAQIRPEQAMYMKKPHRAVGAFAKSIVETETRNDYSQHNLVSLLCLARVLEADQLDVAGASAMV